MNLRIFAGLERTNGVKHTRKKCHFLNKIYRNDRGAEHNFTWSLEDRNNLNLDDRYSASCWRGIWHTGISPELNRQLPNILTQNRRDECFFVEYNQGMSYQAATELHRSRNENRHLKKSYRYSRVALGIATASLLVSLIVCLIQLRALFGG